MSTCKIFQYFIFTTLLIFGMFDEMYAQTIDTIWYNKKWEKVDLPSEYHFYRVIVQDTVQKRYEITDHHSNGQVQMHGYFSSLDPEIRDGEFNYYTEQGIKANKLIWVNNLVAETYAYDAAGKEMSHIIKREYLSTLTDEEKFKKYGTIDIDSLPVFPGGNENVNVFLEKHLVYPPEAVKANIEGLVMITITIDEKGRAKGLKLVKSMHPLLDEEAMRVVKLLPKKGWTPGQDKGKKVTAAFAVPVSFVLK